MESMSRFASPVNPAIYPHLALVLLGIGLFFTAWFFVYEVTSTKFTREIVKEILVNFFIAFWAPQQNVQNSKCPKIKMYKIKISEAKMSKIKMSQTKHQNI
jgi:hypothetical protein